MILEKIKTLPFGYSKEIFQHKKYGLTRTDQNIGNSIKIYAEDLGGKTFISFNYDTTSISEGLKRCEIPQEIVIYFKKIVHYYKRIKI